MVEQWLQEMNIISTVFLKLVIHSCSLTSNRWCSFRIKFAIENLWVKALNAYLGSHMHSNFKGCMRC